MKCGKRAWWNGILRGLGPWLACGTAAVGLLAAEPNRAGQLRNPYRTVAHQETSEPQDDEPASKDSPPPADEPAEPAEPPATEPIPVEPPPPTKPQSVQRPAKSKATPPPAPAEPPVDEPFFDEPFDGQALEHPLWGPVWYGDCGPRPRPLLDIPRCIPRMWIQAEYLLWFQRGTSLPPLVTTSFQGTTIDDAGVLGVATTSVLYGDQTVGNTAQSGGRLDLGWWLDDCQYSGIGTRAFMLATQKDSFFASSDSTSIIARPYFDVSDNQAADQNSLVIAFPGVQTGQISVATTTDIVGGDIYLRRQVYSSNLSRVDLWLGYQYSRIANNLTINSSTTEVSGSQLAVTDQFAARNEFNGAAIGFLASYDRPRWHCDLLAKIGLGQMNQTTNLVGSNTLSDGTDTTTTPAGLLVRSTNSGLRSHNQFACSPELGVTMTWRMTPRWDLSVGYSFIYWTNVLSAAGTIDPQLAANLSEPPTGEQRPAVSMRDDDYWVHGVSFGIVGRF